jgi:hypothetical protein
MGAKKAKALAKRMGKASPKKPARTLTRAILVELYAARRHLGLATLKETGLRMPVEVYFKDPDVAETFENVGIDKEFTAPWEPGLRDGPTSARFAVVDYDSTNNILTPPANSSDRRNKDSLSVPPAPRVGDHSKYARFL